MSSAPRSQSSALLLHGDFVGRYRILVHIADGGMASVYLAELDGPGKFKKQVALKVIHSHLMSDPSFVQMFTDEAQIAARLHHPNIVQTFDLVQTGEHFAIAMEYAPGVPSSALLPDDRQALGLPVSPELVAYIGSEAAAGLHHAHNLTAPSGEPLGVVHRDISPSNVHIGYDGRVRIVDFGVARVRGRMGTTGGGTVKGTFAYIAPEQFTGGELTPGSDVWSLGVVLWELLAGRKLFKRPNEGETIRAVMQADIPTVESLRTDFPLSLGMAISRALQRDPAKRWKSARDLEEALRDVLPSRIESVRDPLVAALLPLREQHYSDLQTILEEEQQQVRSVPPGTETEPRGPAGDDVTPMASADLAARARSGRTGWLAAAGAALLLVVAGIAVQQLSSGPDHGATEHRAAAAPTAEPAAEATPAPAAAARISLDVSSGVAGAEVLLDGERLGPAPLHTLVPSDPGRHVLRVQAAGHAPSEREITLDGPVQLRLDPVRTTPLPAKGAFLKKRGDRPRKLTFDQDVYR